jgi:hypothetical protein
MNYKIKRIVNRNLDTRYNHYIALKRQTRKKSKAEKVVLLVLINICVYSFLFPVMNSRRVVTFTSPIESAQASEYSPMCGLDVVECDNEPKKELKEKSIESMIYDTFPESPAIALAIAKAESGLNHHAVNHGNRNGSKDCGIYQINSVHRPTVEQCTNPAANIALARKIYDSRGDWSAWSAYNNGAYLRHIK